MAIQNVKDTINGFLVIDKPIGISSAKVVNSIKKSLNLKKVGHGGTLDPLASGVLPIAIGEATKVIDYIFNDTKTYTFEVTFGYSTTTDDLEGDVLETSEKIPTKSEILSILPKFMGSIMQVPPLFSAIKVNGKRAYDIARSGNTVDLKSRQVEVKKLELLEYNQNKAKIMAVTGKGFYIRSLARDIAKELGSRGHVSMLRRNSVGKFVENVSLVFKNVYNVDSDIMPSVITLKSALDDILGVIVEKKEAEDIRYGRQLNWNPILERSFSSAVIPSGNLCIWDNNELVAIAQSLGGQVLIKRVFMY